MRASTTMRTVCSRFKPVRPRRPLPRPARPALPPPRDQPRRPTRPRAVPSSRSPRPPRGKCRSRREFRPRGRSRRPCARSSRRDVGGAAGQVFDRLDAVLAEPHQHGRGHARHLFEGILDAEFFALGVELTSILSRYSCAASAARCGSSSKPSMPAISLVSTKASSSTELKPSEASNCPITSSSSRVDEHGVRFSNSAWRCCTLPAR